MTKLPSILAAPFLALFTGNTFAEDLNGITVAEILEKLQQMEKTILGNSQQIQGTAMQRYKEAAGSEKAAVAFYLRCREELEFTRDGAKTNEFWEWRERNEDKLSSKEYVACLRLQLQYLILTIKASQATGEDRGAVIGELQQFMETMIGGIGGIAEEKQKEQEEEQKKRKVGQGNVGPHRKEVPASEALKLLQTPVNTTVFAQAYEFDTALKELADWEMAPLEVASVFEKAIVPYYAEFKPEMVDGAWKNRILFEQKLVELLQGMAASERFNTIRLPQLKWDGAMRKFENTDQVTGTQEMLAILGEYPKHPSSVGWISALRSAMVEAGNTVDAEAAPSDPTDSEGNLLPVLEVVPTE